MSSESGVARRDGSDRSAGHAAMMRIKRIAAAGPPMMPALVLHGILIICGLLLIGIVAVVILGIVARLLIHVSIPWTVEVPDDLVVWLSFLGGTAAAAVGSSIKVDTVVNLAKRRRSTDMALSLVVLALTLIAVVIWAYASLDLLGIAGDTKAAATGIPLRWTRIALPISSLFVCFFIVVQFVRTLRGRDPLEHHYAVVSNDELSEP
jgi:TRAP-type C4-dicarboxylate transport system permease small subunit